MKITHQFSKQKISSSIDDKEKSKEISFLLSDKRGSYFSQGSKENVSFYQGLVFPIEDDSGWNMFKFIESLYLQNSNVSELKNRFNFVQRIGTAYEKFSMPYENTLLYEVSRCDHPIMLELDARHIYDFSTEGRIYEIYQPEQIGDEKEDKEKRQDTHIIRYTKYHDDSLEEVDYRLFMAIRFLDNDVSFEKIDGWVPREYSYDSSRSEKKELYIYQALRFKLEDDNTKSRILFSCASTEEEALELLENTTENLKAITTTHEKHYSEFYGFKSIQDNFRKNLSNDVLMAYLASIKSLDDLIVLIKRHLGIYAGFYWFFHFWTRDESISLKSLIMLKKYSLAKTIIMRETEKILDDGRVPNRYPHSDLGSADGVGWCFFRFLELIRETEHTDKMNKYITTHDVHVMKKRVKESINKLLKNHTQDDLAFSGKKETWIDTSPEDNDDRKGARIEIQALRLATYRLAAKLCDISEDEDKEYYEKLEKELKDKVKDNFFEDGKVADGICEGKKDWTSRPNVFMAYYIYPELLDDEAWNQAFDKVLEETWLDWGGISSISKNDERFQPEYTGENNLSYHRGDSWFFVNNISAIAMFRLNNAKYIEKINKIIKASMNEILFSGIIGASAEISSASELQSKGTWQQAWSSATFIELINEVWGD